LAAALRRSAPKSAAVNLQGEPSGRMTSRCASRITRPPQRGSGREVLRRMTARMRAGVS
jgi:hypothetical protein